MPQPERRQSPRVTVDRPVKLRAGGVRYLAARARNLSSSGALLELHRRAPLLPGQRLQLAMGETTGQPLLRTAQLAEAVVVRCLPHGDVQHLAIRFTRQSALALAG